FVPNPGYCHKGRRNPMTMPTPQAGQSAVLIAPAVAPPPRRHAFGWPPGSIRAVLTLLIVGLVCGLMLMSTPDQPVAIPLHPPYLLYLLFLVLGHYFAARGHSRQVPGEAPPLHLPRGTIRLALVAAIVGTVTWQIVKHPGALTAQMNESVRLLQQYPQLLQLS